MSLTQNQQKIIKSTVPVLAEHGFNITKTMYTNMINESPDLRELFNRTSQVNGRQPAALANVLHAYAANIDNLAALSSAVERICQKHASLYLRPDQYDIVGKYLIQAFGIILGPALTPEILDAWMAAYGQIAALMINREQALYSEANGWLAWREFTIVKKVKESSKITSFYLSPSDKKRLPLFTAGQYISVKTSVPKLGYAQSRQFSLSDAPNQDYYRISVKREEEADGEPHYVTNLLHDEKQVGDKVEVSHPHGDFLLTKPEASTPLVLLSAGVGLTPLLSMLNTTVAKKSSRPISWIHGTRDTSSQAFATHIQQVTKENTNVHAKVFVKNPVETDVEGVQYQVKGRTDLSKLSQEDDLFLGDKTTEYFICGPKTFIRDIRKAVLAFGVDEARVKYEIFAQGDLDD